MLFVAPFLRVFRASRLGIALLIGLAPAAGQAMEYSVVTMAGGLRAVLASGPIVTGDTERLRAALDAIGRDPWGYKTLALNSPGGSVLEAVAIVSLMNDEKVATIVPPGAVCTSACAQMVFLAGMHRMVMDGGRLGLHSCSTNDGARSAVCNDFIARNAVANGALYGTVMAFMQSASPSEMYWFEAKDADCWGLTRWPPGFDRGIQPGEVAPCILKGAKDAGGPVRKPIR